MPHKLSEKGMISGPFALKVSFVANFDLVRSVGALSFVFTSAVLLSDPPAGDAGCGTTASKSSDM